MKKYIKTLEFDTLEDKERMRSYLNGLGFYCLSYGDKTLEVYAIERIIYFEERLREFWSNGVKYLMLYLQLKGLKKAQISLENNHQ